MNKKNKSCGIISEVVKNLSVKGIAKTQKNKKARQKTVGLFNLIFNM